LYLFGGIPGYNSKNVFLNSTAIFELLHDNTDFKIVSFRRAKPLILDVRSY